MYAPEVREHGPVTNAVAFEGAEQKPSLILHPIETKIRSYPPPFSKFMMPALHCGEM
jgi:hypothetical protein